MQTIYIYKYVYSLCILIVIVYPPCKILVFNFRMFIYFHPIIFLKEDSYLLIVIVILYNTKTKILILINSLIIQNLI